MGAGAFFANGGALPARKTELTDANFYPCGLYRLTTNRLAIPLRGAVFSRSAVRHGLLCELPSSKLGGKGGYVY